VIQRKRTKMNIDPKVYNILKKSGWYENRELDEEEIAKKIKDEGYPVMKSVLSFMKNFEGLVIKFDNLQNGLKDDTINLDFEQATHIETPGKIRKSYLPRIQKELCLLGTAYRDHLILLMSEDGYVYGAFENYFCLIEKTGIGALEAIILNKDFEEINAVG
jgi:hypothetical protein